MTAAIRPRVHSSVSNPNACGPLPSACLTASSSAADSRGRRPARPAPRSAASPPLAPAPVPDAGGLGGDPEGAADLGLGGAVGEHAGGFQAPLLQAADVTPPGARLDCGGLLVGLGCHTHASSVPVPIAVFQPNERRSLVSPLGWDSAAGSLSPRRKLLSTSATVGSK